MALGILAEALARVEHKLDLLLKIAKYPETANRPPMQFSVHQCPVCEDVVQYVVDLQKNVVVRRCKCSTGKLPPTFSLFPAVQPTGAEPNGRTVDDTPDEERPTKNRRRR